MRIIVLSPAILSEKWYENRNKRKDLILTNGKEAFPYAERNERKKQLHISEMTFVVQDELWDEYGDSFDAQIMFILDRKTRLISCTQAGASNTIELTAKEMRKLLNRIVNAYEVFCWEEDFSQEMPDVLGEEEDLADIEVSEDEEQPS